MPCVSTNSYNVFACTSKLSYTPKLSLPQTWKCIWWTLLQEDEAVQGLTERMKALLSPFVLRRLKSQVASQLTAKQQHEEVVSMTTEQAALYQKAVQQLRADVAGNVKGVIATLCTVPCHVPCLPPCTCIACYTTTFEHTNKSLLILATTVVHGYSAPRNRWHADKMLGSAGQAVVKQLGKQRVNNLFTHLRKIAQHPLLVRNLYTEAQVERLVTIAHQRWVSSVCKLLQVAITCLTCWLKRLVLCSGGLIM